MVQIISPSPRAMQRADLGRAMGQGLSKQLGLMEAQGAIQQAQGDPLKLATAMARMGMVDPSLEKAVGPMYSAMLADMRGRELAGAQEPLSSQFVPQTQQPQIPSQDGRSPSITESEPLQETRRPYIPREYGQIVTDAQRKYPKLFGLDPEKAIQQEAQSEQQSIARSEALQAQRRKQLEIESTLQGKLKSQMQNLGIDLAGAPVAGNLFSKIEDKAMKSILPKSEGGEGLTEQQAAKKYGDEIESAERW